MYFLHVEFLFLTFLLIPLALFVFKIKKFDIESIFAPNVRDAMLIKKQKGFSKKTRIIFLLISLLMMIIALARPVQEKNETTHRDIEGYNLTIALDISKSMMAKDIFPNRLEYSKKLISQIIDTLSSANIALIAFSNNAFLVSPLSSDKDSVKYLLEHLKPEYLSSSGSSVVSALKATLKISEYINENKMPLLIVSDGADGTNIDKAKELLKDNLQVFVLNIGTKKGEAIELENGSLLKDTKGNIVISKRDDTIMALAKRSGGSFLSVPDSGVSIKALINDIKEKTTKQKIKKENKKEYEELFYYPLIFALFTLFFALNQPRFLAFVFVLFLHQNAQASLLDFLHVKKANESYEKKNYEEASKEFALLTSDEAKYNQANALYKQQKFDEAEKLYEEIKTFKKDKEYQRLHNLGNSYAKNNKIEKAVESYEEALKIKDDEDTLFNLELLKKQQEQQEKQQNNQDNKNQNSQQKNEDSQNKSQEQKKKEESKKQENSSQNKDNKKDEQQKQEATSIKQEAKKPMEETEAKKWEKILKNQEVKTQPLLLEQNKEETSENSW